MYSSYKREDSNNELNVVIKLIIGIRLFLEDMIYSSARFVIDAPRFLIYISNPSLTKFVIILNIQFLIFVVVIFLLRGIGFLDIYDLYFTPLELFIPALFNLFLFFILKVNPFQKEELTEISYDEFQRVKQGYYGEYEEDVEEEIEYEDDMENEEVDAIWLDDVEDNVEITDDENKEVETSFCPNYGDIFGGSSDDLEIIAGITLEDEIVIDLSDSSTNQPSRVQEASTSTEQKIDYVCQVTDINIDNLIENLTPVLSEGISLNTPTNITLPIYDTSSIENTQEVLDELVTNGYSFDKDFSDEKLDKLQEKFKKSENKSPKKYMYEGVEIVSPSQRKLNSALEKMNAYFT